MAPPNYESGFGAEAPPGNGFGSPSPSDGPWDAGYGAPITLDEEVGAGAGYGGGGGSDSGGGNPTPPPSGGGGIPDEPSGYYLASEAFFPVPSDRRPAPEIGDEGGYLLEVVGPPGAFDPEGSYIVYFRRSTSARYPVTLPGAYSAVSGVPYNIVPTRGGRSLRFTSPAMPHGGGADELYDIVVEGPIVGTLVFEDAVNVLPSQHSLEVIAARSLPVPYNPWGDISIYSLSNET